jgi:NADPH2:quinone reductase
MRAIQITSTGGPEVLTLMHLPDPTPGAGEVLVKVEACGVNFIDTYLREGRYAARLPLTLGQEAAGTIVSLGDQVTGFQAGDRVAFTAQVGTYAELAVAPASTLVRIPEGVSTQQAATCLVQGMTAHYLVQDVHKIQPGDEVLIHAAAGGTGLLLVQMAKALGARVITTVGSREKAALAREAGADETILYRDEDFAARVEELTEGRKLAVVYDSVGKATFEGSLRCVRPRGLLALFGGASGAVPPFDFIRLSQMGSLFVTRPTLKDYVSTRAELERRASEVFSAVAEGRLKIRISKTYALEDAAQAHRDLESRATTGKLILIP